MTGHQVLHTLSVFFSNTEHETAIFFFLVLPFFVFLTSLLFVNKGKKPHKVSSDKISSSDMQIMEIIRLQKGLETHDRDFLIEIALSHGEKPYYLLIDQKIFERAQAKLRAALVQQGEKPDENKRYKLLLKLKGKLFNL